MRIFVLLISIVIFCGCGEKNIRDYTIKEIQADSNVRKRYEKEISEKDRLYLGFAYFSKVLNIESLENITIGEILQERDEKRTKALKYTMKQMIDDEKISEELTHILTQAEQDTIYERGRQYGYRGDSTFFGMTVEQVLK